jgi:hypothetical protein
MVVMNPKAERRCLCTTEKNYLYLAPPDAKVGDNLYILLGGIVPYILRKMSGDAFTLVGECYVHGLMKGEAFKNENVKGLIKEIKLV